MPLVFLDIIIFWYDKVYCRVRWDDTYSSWFRGMAGVRQGGILSPLIFNFYVVGIMDEINKMSVGCRLDSETVNNISYADDMILLAPSLVGLQHIVDKLSVLLHGISLKVNVSKSAYILFDGGRKMESCSSIKLLGVDLKRVDTLKYLGLVFRHDLSNSTDIDRVMNSFLQQFNSVYRKFNFVDKEVLLHLFRSYTSSFYGMESWCYKLSNMSLRKISVAYHKAVKRICGYNTWDSNHRACDDAGVPIFKHLHALRLIKYIFSLINTESVCLKRFKYFFRYRSYTFKEVEHFFAIHYDLFNVFNNPICAIISRIFFVQRNEPRLSDLR